MKLRIYERPAGYEDEYGDWMEWDASYDEYLAETAERTGGGFETFTWMTWGYDMTARPFVWINERAVSENRTVSSFRDRSENDGEAIFIGMFFFRKADEDVMEVFIKTKYPEAGSVEFLDEAAHFGRMYGFHKSVES